MNATEPHARHRIPPTLTESAARAGSARVAAVVLAGAAVWAAWAIGSAGDARAAAAPKVDAKSQEAYRDLFGAEHDAVTVSKKPADKVAFAKKLLEASKTVRDNRALSGLIARHAETFAAADKTGLPVRVELKKMQLQDDPGQVTLMTELADLLDLQYKAEPFGTRLKVAADLYALLRELAVEQARREDYDGAVATLGKAKSTAKNLRAVDIREAVRSVDEEVKALEAKIVRERNIARLRAILEKAPRDAKANLELALIHIADGDLKQAAGHFELCDQPEVQQLGKLLAAEKASDADLGDACRKAAAKLPAGDDRVRLLRMCVSHYERFLAEHPTGGDSGRIKLLLPTVIKELPAEAPVTTVFRAVCIFDEDKVFLDLLIRGTGGGKAKVEKQDCYSGISALRVSGGDNKDVLAGFKYRVVERPSGPDEIRFLRFAVKAPAGDGLAVTLARDGKIDSGAIQYVMRRNPPALGWGGIRLSNQPPTEWMVVTRDLFKDFGPFIFTGLSLHPGNGIGLFDAFYVAKTASDFPPPKRR